MLLVLLSFLSAAAIAPTVAVTPSDEFLIETEFVLENPSLPASEIIANLTTSLEVLYNNLGNELVPKESFNIEVFNASTNISTEVTTATYSVNTTSESNERLNASYAILVLGSLSNATYATNLNMTFSVKDVLQKANPVGAALPTQGIVPDKEKYLKDYGLRLDLIPNVTSYEPAYDDSLREMYSSVGVNVTIQIHSFLKGDTNVELVFTVSLWSDGTTSTAAYASGTVWSNRFALIAILRRNKIDSIFDKTYKHSENRKCFDVKLYSFLDFLRDPSVDTDVALAQPMFIKEIGNAFLNSSDSSPGPPVVCYVFTRGVLTVTVGIAHGNKSLNSLDLINYQGFCRQVLQTRSYDNHASSFIVSTQYNSSSSLGMFITENNQCPRSVTPNTTVTTFSTVEPTVTVSSAPTSMETAIPVDTNPTTVETTTPIGTNPTTVETTTPIGTNPTTGETTTAMEINSTPLETASTLGTNPITVETATTVETNPTTMETAITVETTTAVETNSNTTTENPIAVGINSATTSRTTTAVNETTSSTITCAVCGCDCFLITLLWVAIGLLVLCIIILIVVILMLMLWCRKKKETHPITNVPISPSPVPTITSERMKGVDGSPALSPSTPPLKSPVSIRQTPSSSSTTPIAPLATVLPSTPSPSLTAPAPPPAPPEPLTIPKFSELIGNQPFFTPASEINSLIQPIIPKINSSSLNWSPITQPKIPLDVPEERESSLDGPWGLNVPQAHGRASRAPRHRSVRASKYMVAPETFTTSDYDSSDA